jgi:ABC-2 type transport system permease protein
MMDKVFNLTKILLKNTFAFVNGDKNKTKKNIIFYILIAVYLFVCFGGLSLGLIKSLKEVNQEGLFISLAFIFIIFMIIFTTIFSQINVFYFSKDITYLLPLPLKPKEIFLAKFNILLVYEYFIEIVFVVPTFIIYGVTTNAGILYYLYALIALALVPIVPLIIVSLIIMVIMCFSKLTKYKDRFQLFTALLAIVIAIGMQFVPRYIGMDSNGNMDILALISKSNSFVDIISKYFITLGPSTKALVYSSSINGLLQLLLLVAITGVFTLVYVLIGDKIYFKGLTGNMENPTSKSKYKFKDVQSSIRSPFMAYLDKEIKPLYRNPVFFMQCVLPAFLMPILFSFIFLAYPDEVKADIGGLLSGINLLNNRVLFIILTGIQFLATMNFTTITAFSREGTYASYNKTLPMSYYTQCIAKMVPGLILNIFSLSIILAILYIFIRLSIIMIILDAIISMIINIVLGYLMLNIDLKKPKLNWDTEYAVVKQNFNFFYEMIINLTLIGALILMSFIPNSINVFLTAIIMVLILIAIWWIVDRIYRKNEEKLLDKIQ